MSLLPYFRWYPADADTDEKYSTLTDEELGFFHRCLNRSWINCGLPSEMDKLAQAMRVTPEYLERVWPAVSQCFKLTDTVRPRYVNPRQEKERELAISKSRQSADAVAERQRKREARGSDDDRTMDRTMNVRSSDDGSNDHPRAYESESESKEQQKTSLRQVPVSVSQPEWKRDEVFCEFVTEYQKSGAALLDEDFSEAYQWVWKKFDWEQKKQRMDAVRGRRWGDPAYVHKPRKFLDVEWKRPQARARDSPGSVPAPNMYPDADEWKRDFKR